MKSNLIRWSATLGLVGSTLVGTWLGFALQALAIPQDQIVQKLNNIPVFAIGDDKGGIFLETTEDKKKVILTYLSQQDAQKTVDQLAKKNPNAKIQVIPMPLGKVYESIKDKKGAPNNVDLFSIAPLNNQLTPALTLLQQEDPKAKSFPGVPVFYAIAKKDKEVITFSFNNGDKVITPLFLEKESLVNLIDKVKKEQPNTSQSWEIKVTPLANLIATFENSNDDWIRTIVLIPSRESEDFLQKLQSQQQNQSKPANAPPTNNTPPTTPKK